VLIEQDLSLPGHRDIFVIGDMSALIDVEGRQVPGLAAAAMQQGQAAAVNILRDQRGAPRLPFRYRDWGSMATIGHHRAVAEIGSMNLSGVIAWLLWSVVHVFLLIGFRNRVAVMGQWIWAYVTREGSSPLITEHQQAEAGSTRATHLSAPAGRKGFD
jgi:NADH dehydrogenase